MADNTNQDNLFRVPRSRAELKADATNTEARRMIEAEAANREAKTARLRKARLEKEAEETAAAPEKKPATRKRAAAKKKA